MKAGSGLRRLIVALLLGGLLLASPPTSSGGLTWDVGIFSGYVCVVLVICLYLYPLRGDGVPHRRLYRLSQHRRIGWWVLGMATLHIAILWISQPFVGRYLSPSAPIFMWCGMIAIILAATLVQTGLLARTALRKVPKTATAAPRSSTAHVVFAALMVATLFAHLAGSSQWLAGLAKPAAVCLLLVLPLAWFAFRPRHPRSHQTSTRRAAHVLTITLIPFLPTSLAHQTLLAPAARPSPIVTNFPHESHIEVACSTCHHNLADATGQTPCIECHRSQRTDLLQSSEATFHTFCRGCHTKLAADGAPQHGPTRACSQCHQPRGTSVVCVRKTACQLIN